ncbi:hypothetical protein LTR10_019333 [Elasticomyces elasticus]|uniref:Isochorismatase-like domain-containing protein n=1 Tax=Exophiala sideris TaxID=1016849 RepID=A0ABR0J2F7_9EURO|nr:hypothetical protein LTR10_019333 [Elasticomyces elasticus]KAK5024334.1 hypothetical protein LTS07_008625 [Exophiala sideris]KAK5030984.1 hypothetical protein LTR13_007997 [Exophiala sideris]KAK5054067.1 hypothetical protein LTR69_009029 [Exophiala sideris]KAK5179577.1 hypothetical protein LTR44_008093 [Eurotiomycetes sp. CCFEE 6388]
MNNAPPVILDAGHPCSPLAIPATKTALLLLDFHKFIVASQPGQGKEVVVSATSTREWARKHEIKVVHCLIDLKASTVATRKMASRANQIRDKMSLEPPEHIGEVEELAASADEYVFWRPPSHVSAMGSYGLSTFLEEHQIQSLILAGFSTSGCVINTAKGAADSGFVVTVLEDACGDKMPDAQEVIMKKLLVGQCHVVEHKKIVEAWDQRDDGNLLTQTAELSISAGNNI